MDLQVLKKINFLSDIALHTATSIHKKLGIDVVSDSKSLDLYRGIRGQLASLLDGLDPGDLSTMSLGLSHSLSRCVDFNNHRASKSWTDTLPGLDSN
jgi:hypothetical protein